MAGLHRGHRKHTALSARQRAELKLTVCVRKTKNCKITSENMYWNYKKLVVKTSTSLGTWQQWQKHKETRLETNLRRCSMNAVATAKQPISPRRKQRQHQQPITAADQYHSPDRQTDRRPARYGGCLWFAQRDNMFDRATCCRNRL